MKKRILFLTLLTVATLTASAQQKYPWQNPQLSTAERVENLISMLTPEEKVGLMMNKSISIDRLGIPSYNWWSEACHGVRQGGYTVFPQPIGMAAAFSEKLIYDVFSAVSDEARANWNRSDHNVFNVPMGVTYYPGNPELTFCCQKVFFATKCQQMLISYSCQNTNVWLDHFTQFFYVTSVPCPHFCNKNFLFRF